MTEVDKRRYKNTVEVVAAGCLPAGGAGAAEASAREPTGLVAGSPTIECAGESSGRTALEPEIWHSSQYSYTEGSQIDEFELLSIIGEGGMGRVFKARHNRLDKVFAVKLVHPELVANDLARKRFCVEAKAATDLTHANLVAVYGQGETKEGSPYLVMDLIDGESLADVIEREGFLDVPRALNIFIQITEALAHAHLKNVVHRDLKPSNILLTRGDDGVELVKVFDFGIAKIFDGATLERATGTGEVFGSPSYMSPEQCLGGKLDNRSDIYSLGCIMYEALTGRPAFEGANPIQTIMKHLNDEPPALVLAQGGQGCNLEALAGIVMTALSKDQSTRYQSMDELGVDLKRVRDGLLPRKSKRALPKAKTLKSQTRSRAVTAAAVLMALLTMFGVAFALSNGITGSYPHKVSIKTTDGRLLYQCFVTDGLGGAIEDAVVHGKDLSGANFAGQEIRNIWLQYATLRNCNFAGCHLINVSIRDSEMKGCNFEKATLDATQLHNCNLVKSNFDSASIDPQARTRISNCNFSLSSMREFKAPFGKFENCLFTGANMQKADLHTAYFGSCNLTGVDFDAADLNEASLDVCVLTKALMKTADTTNISTPECVSSEEPEDDKGSSSDK